MDQLKAHALELFVGTGWETVGGKGGGSSRATAVTVRLRRATGPGGMSAGLPLWAHDEGSRVCDAELYPGDSVILEEGAPLTLDQRTIRCKYQNDVDGARTGAWTGGWRLDVPTSGDGDDAVTVLQLKAMICTEINAKHAHCDEWVPSKCRLRAADISPLMGEEPGQFLSISSLAQSNIKADASWTVCRESVMSEILLLMSFLANSLVHAAKSDNENETLVEAGVAENSLLYLERGMAPKKGEVIVALYSDADLGVALGDDVPQVVRDEDCGPTPAHSSAIDHYGVQRVSCKSRDVCHSLRTPAL